MGTKYLAIPAKIFGKPMFVCVYVSVSDGVGVCVCVRLCACVCVCVFLFVFCVVFAARVLWVGSCVTAATPCHAMPCVEVGSDSSSSQQQ